MQRRAYWICQLLGWGAYVAFTTVQLGGVSGPLVAAAIGIFLTGRVRARAQRERWVAGGMAPLGRRFALTALALATVHVVALAAYESAVTGVLTTGPAAFFAILRWTLVFAVWLALYLGAGLVAVRHAQELRAVRLEAELERAQLRALEAQLNPHFLFNALNSVRALVAEDPERARAAITQLARLLRYTLRVGAEGLVPLQRELEIVDDYLALEGLRLGERLAVERRVTREAAAGRIPVMLVQTLVENAIKHGIADLPEGGVLALDARLAGDTLLVEVSNPRPLEPRGDAPGVGLANARDRLALEFGTAGQLELDLSVPGRATARARLPVAA